jgi:hypothetical protein
VIKRWLGGVCQRESGAWRDGGHGVG